MFRTLLRPIATLALTGTLVLVGCDDSPTDPPVDPQPSSVDVSAETSTLTYIGAETTLSAIVRDDTGSPIQDATVTWSSSDNGVVAVTNQGEATAVSSGTATITATSGSASGTTTLTVAQEPDSISASEDDVLLAEIGATEQIEVTLLDAGGTPIEDADLTWSSSDETVATVSSTGLIEAVAAGTAVVTAESGDLSATVDVQVQPATSIQMDPADLSLTSIGDTGTVSATLRDAGGAEIVGIPLTWASSDEAVATVNADGMIEAVGTGTATITASFGSGSMQGITTVTVSQTSAEIELTPSEVTLVTVGATTQLTAVVSDAGGTEIEGAAVTWTSSDTAIATVDSDGEVTAVANGTAVITAQSGEASATSTVTVDIDG